MGMKSIRLASMLSFDEQQEADIIRLIEAFNSSHKMGEFLSNLIRVAVENPEIVVAKDGKYDTGAIIKVMERLGKSPTRHNYMQEANKKLADMQVKVDEIYEMCLKMYTALEMGKQLGFEKKTENMILAQFMVEQQLGQLQKILGADCANVPFAANRLANYKDRAAGTLEYIISCYEPVINELRKELTVKELVIPVQPLEIPIQGMVYQPVNAQVAAPVVETPVAVPVVAPQPVAAPVEVVTQQTVVAPQPVVTPVVVEEKKEALTFENISKMDDEDDIEVDLGSTPEVSMKDVKYDDEALALLNDFFNDGM